MNISVSDVINKATDLSLLYGTWSNRRDVPLPIHRGFTPKRQNTRRVSTSIPRYMSLYNEKVEVVWDIYLDTSCIFVYDAQMSTPQKRRNGFSDFDSLIQALLPPFIF
jgi:hypothetical protein